MKTESAGLAQTTSFFYDADGNPTRTLYPNNTNVYTPFPDYEEEVPSGDNPVITQRATFSANGQVAVAWKKVGAGPAALYSLHTNHLGSVMHVGDASGARIDSGYALYEPFGVYTLAPTGMNLQSPATGLLPTNPVSKRPPHATIPLMLHLYSWNVNGLRAVHRKGIFLEWLARAKPDILGLQETKAHPDQLDDALRAPPGYHTFWAASARPGYSGVALYTRREPLAVAAGLGIDEYDREGRTLVADYGDFVFITAYFPNGSRDHVRVPFKMQYNADFLATIDALRAAGRPVIFCGDVNTSHQEIDLARPRQNRNTTGFLPIEREWLDSVVARGYVDTFRARYPDQAGAYTWWAQFTGSRQKNVGWRLDYFFVSPDLWPRVIDAAIHPDVMGSDHCPVSLTLDFNGTGE